MEKVLRKVMCSERLPSKSGNYVCKRDKIVTQIFFAVEDAGFHNYWNSRVEYWYEEVDLLKAFKDAYKTESVDNTKEKFENNDAKERFEKALEYIETHSTTVCYLKQAKNAIKIAAGLKD